MVGSHIDLAMTGSWDKSVKIWDLKSNQLAHTLNQNDKVFTMDAVDNKLVVGLAGRIVQIYDLRYLPEPLESREATLKHMLRQV